MFYTHTYIFKKIQSKMPSWTGVFYPALQLQFVTGRLKSGHELIFVIKDVVKFTKRSNHIFEKESTGKNTVHIKLHDNDHFSIISYRTEVDQRAKTGIS